jgi:23S rRNA pseudouridine1911/1915/1917 synthase
MQPESGLNLEILYEDNHLIAVNKRPSQIAQGDKTGDASLPDQIKEYLKKKYDKPGNVFCGVIHRLDRPTSGIVLFARTSKALERMNRQFQEKTIQKKYWAMVEKAPAPERGTLIHALIKNEKQNKSYVCEPDKKGAKKAILHYKMIQKLDNYVLLEISLETGRHHQIRTQLAHMGCPIKGDVKYGAKRANDDRSISLHARELRFHHPISKQSVLIQAPCPENSSWRTIQNLM